MGKKFYIDESGNTGDLVVSTKNSNFSSQEYFTLACVGVDDSKLQDLEEYITNLKVKYKIQTPELKFSKMKGLFGKKMGFVLELLKYIEESSNFIIEIVDKKYIISTNIVTCLINPPYFQPYLEQHESQSIHFELCQWVYDNVTLDFLINFTNVARNPTEVGLNELFEDLLTLARGLDDPLSDVVSASIVESMDDFNVMKQRNNMKREAYTFFLPLPDTNKKGNLIGILPYVSSFYNIYARLNSLFNRDLSKVVLVHDNQSHFDEIIRFYHESAVNYTHGQTKVFDNTDFIFLNTSSLDFKDDKDLIGLQVADLFAGFINKAIPFLVDGKNQLEEKETLLLYRIITSLYYKQSINFVLPKEHHERLFFTLDHWVHFQMELSDVNRDKFDEFLLET